MQYLDGFGYIKAGEIEKSITAFSSYIEHNKLPSGKVYLFRGIAYYKAKHYLKAIDDFAKAREKQLASSYYWMAKALVRADSQEEAFKYLEKCLYISKGEYADSIKKDTVFKRLYAYNEWFDLWQNEINTRISSINEEINYYIENNEYEKAHSYIESLDPSTLPQGYLRMLNAKVYYQEENLKLAISEMTMAIREDPDEVGYYILQGQYLLEDGNIDYAIKNYTRALELSPEKFDVIFKRAESRYKTKLYEEALADINIYLNYLQFPKALILKAEILSELGKNFEALKIINPLFDKDLKKEELSRIYFVRGIIYFNSNMKQLAVNDVSMSLDLYPNDAVVNTKMGYIQYKMGKTRMACHYWGHAFRNGSREALVYLKDYCE